MRKGNVRYDGQGNPLQLEILTMNHPTHLNLGELLVAQLSKIGIQASFRPLTAEALRNRLMAADFQAAVSGLNFGNHDMVFFYFHSSRGEIVDGRVSGFNYGGHSNPEFDSLSEAMRVEMNDEKRIGMLMRLQELMANAYYQTMLMLAVMTIFGNLAADFVYLKLYPRVNYE